MKSYILSLKSPPLMEATLCKMEAISLSRMYADTSIISLQMGSISSYILSFELLETDCLALRAMVSTVMYIPIRFPYHASNTNDMKFMNGWNSTVLVDAIANCLVQKPSGVVESCSSFSTTNNPTAANACTEQSPVYPCEKAHGTLTSLPGCTNSGGVITCPGGVQPACAANFATIGLVVSPGNNQYSSIGCYTEATTGRALATKSYSDPIWMTVESCLAFCSGFTYAGVEYGQEVCSLSNYLRSVYTDHGSLVLLRQHILSWYNSCI
jgi:hypothetical protein